MKEEHVEYPNVKKVVLTRSEESALIFYGHFPEDMATCSKIWLMKLQVLLAFKSRFSRSKRTRHSVTITTIESDCVLNPSKTDTRGETYIPPNNMACS